MKDFLESLIYIMSSTILMILSFPIWMVWKLSEVVERHRNKKDSL